MTLDDRLETGWFSSRVYSSAMGQNLARTVGRHVAPEIFLTEAERAKAPLLAEKSDLTTPWPDLARDVIRLKNKGRKLRLREFDDVITSKIGGLRKDEGGCFPFKDADDYYEHASSKPFIKGVRRPLLGINAFDDPIIHGCEFGPVRGSARMAG
jgi:predicted alpha/beta-fold hydrolase